MKLSSTLLAVIVFSPLILLAQVLLAQSAQAALLAGDLVTTGDGLITKDSRTGLEWLDLTLTRGASYDAVAAGFGGYTTQNGFRFASAAEVNALQASALEGKVAFVLLTSNVNDLLTAEYFAAGELNELLGVTFPMTGNGFTFNSSVGYVAPASATGIVTSLSIGSEITSVSNSPVQSRRGVSRGFTFTNSTTVGSTITGSFLVRSSSSVQSTPEPSLLIGSAIVLTGLLKPRSAKISG
jgi:hypothetical protein